MQTGNLKKEKQQYTINCRHLYFSGKILLLIIFRGVEVCLSNSEYGRYVETIRESVMSAFLFQI